MSRLSISSSFLVYCHLRYSLDGNLVKFLLKKCVHGVRAPEGAFWEGFRGVNISSKVLECHDLQSIKFKINFIKIKCSNM